MSPLSRLEALFQRRPMGVKFSLDGIRRLCSVLGNPQENGRFIHIAGTNGKGSVAAMCSAILTAAGLRTGLYTSPHLARYHERFRMDGKEIPEDELMFELEGALAAAPEATFFEVSTALALGWFRKKGAQMVVWETGLGGRLDATNIVTPQVSVITPIGMDHTQFLGNTLTAIAREKAGIIKPGVPVLSSPQSEEVMGVLQKTAVEKKAPFRAIQESDLHEFESPLSGDYQAWNTALAVAAVRAVRPTLQASVIQAGLRQTRWPGRCQLIQRGGGLPSVLIDGAHNPLGIQSLVREIEKRWGCGQITLILGILSDKAVHEIAQILGNIAAQVFLCPVASDRSADPETLAFHFEEARRFSSLAEALAVADACRRPIVIAGSLFLAGEALGLLGGHFPQAHPNESLSPAY